MFDNLNVSTRLSLGLGAIVLLGMGIVGYGAWSMNRLNEHVGELANERMVKVTKFSRLMDNLNTIGRSARNVVITDDAGVRQAEKQKIAALRAENSALLADIDSTVRMPKGREQLQVINDNRGNYNKALDRVMAAAEANDKALAKSLLFGEVQQLQTTVFDAVDGSRALQQDIADNIARNAQSTASVVVWVMAGLLLGMAAIGAGVGLFLSRSLRRALGAEPAELSLAVNKVADGDLSQSLAVQPGDSTSVLAAVARMQGSLDRVVTNVRTGAESVAIASAEIASGNNDLSSRTEQQASALEQTAASMEELSSTVKQNADNARQANQLAMSASTVAIEGGDVVHQVVETMRGINESSKKIADIIGTIDGIAFQTNILALNAAVEAARAGEQGRGFAVVASEVRSLAQRSAEAAKEIKLLIGASVQRVEQGTALVDKAGATMTEVVTSIRRVTDIMGEISSASTEQSQGVAQVGEAVTQMDQATQQNAALVEESAAAAESLKQQAAQMVQTIAMFKLAKSSSAPATVVAAPQTASKAPGEAIRTATAKPAIERRSPARAKNVTRPNFQAKQPTAAAPRTAKEPTLSSEPAAVAPAAASTGSDDWTTF